MQVDLTRFFKELEENHFFGELQLIFKDGNLTHLKKTEVLTPKDLVIEDGMGKRLIDFEAVVILR